MRQNRGVDSDEFATIVDQCTAGVAWIDWRIGLNEIFVVFNAEVAAAFCADDSHSYGLTDAERIADSQSIVADLHLGGVAKRNGRKIRAFELQDGHISFWIRADDLCFELASIG